MDVTPLHIILAVVAVFLIFGPKRLPKREPKAQSTKSIKVARERANARPAQPILPSGPTFGPNYAAGRAPSPLQLRAAERPLPPLGQPEGARPQFSKTDTEGSPLPHEMLRV